MRVVQFKARDLDQLAAELAEGAAVGRADLALVFGAPAQLGDPRLATLLRQTWPSALLGGCSTAGEITTEGIANDSLVVTVVEFARVKVFPATTELAGMEDSRAAGVRLGEALRGQLPKAILLFGQGVAINGSGVIDGMRSVLGDAVPITGGLAGDGTRFQETLVLTPAGASGRALLAIGLKGEGLCFSHGSFGGWETFGTLRKVTRSAGNVLFELDGKRALDIYKEYLGDYARDLPSSGLLFPFEMVDKAHGSTGVIRTILAMDDAEGSLTLAGDIEPGGYLQLMHASTDRLVDGAENAAEAVKAMGIPPGAGLAILVSCVGRKLVMGDRVDEEIEAVADVLGRDMVLTGFYSYGEISPPGPGASCRLHNQTMTVTVLAETA